MALFRCRTFLGCMSLRTGVWLLALLAILVSGLGSAGSWLEVTWMAHHPLVLRDKVATIIQAGAFSLLFLLSLLGFFAALNGKRGVVYIYSKFTFIHAPLIMLSLAVTLFTTLKPDMDQQAVENCLNGTKSPIISQFCNHGLSVVRILPIAFLGAALLIQFCVWIVATSYGEEIDRGSDFADSDLEATRSMLQYPEPPFAARR
ncbi:Tetraspanin family [Mycena venus]|uniref:Tetraspanin family n=1 Tax=Mycena venus TaxID=2733690 RepID=A0A8H6XCI5_9AGAR|nr:Tetraspanin family [Mycena venus]